MNNSEIFNTDHNDCGFIENSDNFTELFSIIEANDEQFRCIWKKIEDQTSIIKRIQQQIVICENNHIKHLKNLKDYNKLSDKVIREIDLQNNHIDKEFTKVYVRINNDEQVNYFLIIIMSILLVSIAMQHYDMVNMSEYQNISNTEL